MPETILVTGGAGFIGSHVAATLLADSLKVRVFDDLSSGLRRNVPEGCEFVEGDIRDEAALSQAMAGVDRVCHLAAFVSHPESYDRPMECLETNFMGTRNVIRLARRHKLKKIVFSSSSAIYRVEPLSPKREDSETASDNPYAMSKLYGEYLLRELEKAADIPWVALRYFNVYGPRQTADSPYSGVVAIFMERALSGSDIVIYGDGMQTRDFVFAGDVARANLLALTRGQGAYNIGTGKAVSIEDLAKMILGLAGCKPAGTPRMAPSRLGDAPYSCADSRHAREGLSWEPRISLPDGLKMTLKNLQKTIGVAR